ncbi:MAG: Spy/CpxP family protein refolding chaperone [Planctomycetes bacterium]|nr:Spy/CpxP family protein refolding chaperone [Planctomycetota bacterium]
MERDEGRRGEEMGLIERMRKRRMQEERAEAEGRGEMEQREREEGQRREQMERDEGRRREEMEGRERPVRRPEPARGANVAPGRGMGGVGRLLSPQAMERLGLSEEQQAKIREIQTEVREQMQQMVGRAREALKDVPAEERAERMPRMTERVQAERNRQMEAVRGRILEVLTPDQREKAEGLLEGRGPGRPESPERPDAPARDPGPRGDEGHFPAQGVAVPGFGLI